MVVHDRLLTNSYRAHIGIADSTMCPRCNTQPETILHILRDFTQAVWKKVIPNTKWDWFMNLPTHTWLRQIVNDTNRIGVGLSIDWTLLFLALIWFIWKGRDAVIFEHHAFVPSTILRQAYTYVLDLQISVQQMSSYVVDPINGQWSKPPPGYLKLNVYGGFLDSQGSFGGLLRNEDGVWQWGFAGRFDASSALQAELKALQVGLQALLDRNLTRVIIESDSSHAINLIHGHPDDDHPCLPEILSCKSSQCTLWSSPLMYISRVCNKSTHCMAWLGLLHVQPSLVWFDVIPAFLHGIVKLDNMI